MLLRGSVNDPSATSPCRVVQAALQLGCQGADNCVLASAGVLQSKMDSFLLALFVLVSPALCYMAIHASVINHWMHFWSMLILGSAPLLYICAIPQGLWWVPMPPRLITGLSRLLMVLAAFGLLAGG
jgi:hypothetical protein